MSVAYAATWWALPGTVGAGVLKTEKSSCSKPKSQAAQTRKLETIKHTRDLRLTFSIVVPLSLRAARLYVCAGRILMKARGGRGPLGAPVPPALRTRSPRAARRLGARRPS